MHTLFYERLHLLRVLLREGSGERSAGVKVLRCDIALLKLELLHERVPLQLVLLVVLELPVRARIGVALLRLRLYKQRGDSRAQNLRPARGKDHRTHQSSDRPDWLPSPCLPVLQTD